MDSGNGVPAMKNSRFLSLIFEDYFMHAHPGRPTIAIVILNWNGRPYLEKFLPSVLASTYPAKEIIIADNGSTDDSVSFLRERFPQVRLIILDRNYGFAQGYNEALRQVQSDYYVLLNSDVEVEPGWIEPIAELMETNRAIGACQPKIMMWADRQQFEYAGAAGGWLDCLGYPFARGRVFDVCEQDRGQYDQPEPIFWASGAAMFVRAELYHRLGGLDGFFFAHQEEIDFCWRLQLAGSLVYCCPSSRVYHVGGGTLPKGDARKVFLNFRNNMIMLAKNLPTDQKVWKIPFRFVLDAVSGFKSLFSGQSAYFFAILRAHGGFLMWWMKGGRGSRQGDIRIKRHKLRGWYSHSVAWQYFVRGRKTFGEIMGGKS